MTIRVGIIGITSSPAEGLRAGQWGLQHLSSLANSPYYEIVAICNSTEESARKAIKLHNLGSQVKAYGSAEDIANDPNVDLVVVAVHVSKHYILAKPALQKGKDVLVEFPLARTLAEGKELAALARQGSIRSAVGAQGRADPGIRHMKRLIQDKVIGDVVMSSWVGQFPVVAGNGWLHEVRYNLDSDSGATQCSIPVGHALAAFTYVLGDFETVQSLLKTSIKTTKTYDDQGNIVDPEYKITAPDTLLIQGILNSGAVVTFSNRTTSAAIDDIGYRWLISGTKGEIELTTEPGCFNWPPPGMKIRLRKWGQETEEVNFNAEEGEHIFKVSQTGRNVARMYEAFAKGEQDGYATIEDAFKVQQLMDQVIEKAIWAP